MAETVNPNPASAQGGLNLSNVMSQIKPGQLTYSLGAVTSDFNGNTVKYQNEPGFTLCNSFPTGYKVINGYNIPEEGRVVIFLANPTTGASEIGIIKNCIYETYINTDCLNLSIDHPIHKIIHRITPAGTEIYWPDGYNNRRFLNLDKKPYKQIPKLGTGQCGFEETTEIDCNLLNLQPNFSIPSLRASEVHSDGQIKAGTVQFAFQYANAEGEAYTAFYSVTNPLSLFDPYKITMDFDFVVGKAVKVLIENIDISGFYDYFNLAVIHSVNGITTPELVGTYRIDADNKTIIYSGQSKTNIRLSMNDIFEKFPIFTTAEDIFTVGDVLGWDILTKQERINYQSIWSKVAPLWQTYRIPAEEHYREELNTQDYKGYMRDEVYPLEGVFLLRNGYQTDRFHIPGRESRASDLTYVFNDDLISETATSCNPSTVPLHRWKVYNTGTLLGDSYPAGKHFEIDDCYKGPYQYGEFGYHESTDTYPCDEAIWGDLAGKPIRHHRFPDSSITHIHDEIGNIYPIGIKIDIQQLQNIINQSSLTQAQKDDIVGFKILRGDRLNNKSVVAKGLIHNVLKYHTEANAFTSPQQTIIDQVIKLQEIALDYIHKAKRKLLFHTVPLNNARDYVIAAGTDPNNPAYIPNLQAAASELKNLLDSGISNDKAEAYIETALSVIQSMLEITYDPTINDVAAPSTNNYYFPNYLYNDVSGTDPYLDNIDIDIDSKSRYTFHSPDTHFYQPFLGNILKIETVEYGKSSGHQVEVKKHAKYQFISLNAYLASAIVGLGVGFASGEYGTSNKVFDGTAAFTTYKTVLDIIYKVAPRRNFAYQYNSVGNYSNFKPAPQEGFRQRMLDISAYLVPGMVSVGDTYTVNNYQRESSVYLRTTKPLLYTHETSTAPVDVSKFIIPDYGVFTHNIASYYAAVKNYISNQYGQIFSYEAIDTGFQGEIDLSTLNIPQTATIFGGDIFINKFAYKSKIPFFLDNRVGLPDESDIFYDELSNVGKPKWWFSTDATSKNTIFGSLFGIKKHKFYWRRDTTFADYGNIFLFAYGVPFFFCESEVNVDYRQAFNDTVGDFYPRMGNGIPDEWFQEINTPIATDNTYHYNKTYSKQSRENFFSTLPDDYLSISSREKLTHTAVYSDPQQDISNYTRNNWLIYRPVSRFDFPRNYGKLVSIEGLDNRAILVRYENKSQVYNALTTINTSSPQAAYLGNDKMFKGSPPLDLYPGTLNKLFIRTKYGHIMVDCLKGNISILNGTQSQEVSGDVGIFISENIKFFIRDRFPDYPIDNHQNYIGLTGVFDPDFDRVIITKRDYQCLDNTITTNGQKFFKGTTEVSLDNTTYFSNKSFSLSFGFDIKTYVSFHPYIPNFYIPDLRGFYAGTNVNSPSSIWKFNEDPTLFNNVFGEIVPYILEYPFSYQFQDEILQNVRDYTRVLKYEADKTFIQVDDIYFNKAILHNAQHCSGILELALRPKNSLKNQIKYPIYNPGSKTILYTKANSFYNYNTFWSLIKDKTKPIWINSNQPSIFKELNQANMVYSKLSFNKVPIRSKDLKIRHILDNTSRYHLISEFIISPSVQTYR